VNDDRRAGAPPPAGHADGIPSSAAHREPLGLEALGLLASGIAHDFNNILAAVRGNAGLARDALADPTPDVAAARDDLVEVERAVERASALVRQLLAFGRRQVRAPEPLDLNRLVRDGATLLRVLVGEEIRLSLRLDPEVPPVHADRSQVEQVVMNLVLNGRDAIVEAGEVGPGAAGPGEVGAGAAGAGPAGAGGVGTLTITTEVASVAAADVRRSGVPAAGLYVRLSVRDDGAGMSEETRQRIFEPFFTTKSPDRGTGLGLAAVWGIVRQSGGGISVESAPGEGSDFAVYLPVAVPRPRTQAGASTDHAAAAGASTAGGAAVGGVATVAGEGGGAAGVGTTTEGGPDRAAPPVGVSTVLLAEDDHAVRRVAARILRNAGFRVLEAGDGRSALALWRAHAGEVGVLIADVRMPQLRGDDLAAAVLIEAPQLPVVLMTGFAEEPTGVGVSAATGQPVPPSVRLLPKPFAAAELLARVHEALAAAPGPGGAVAGVVGA
jgi:signal transduction histidine kinase/ActR/RegA family two-component response regulator